MKLYKNVDICDLESILAKGILSIDASGNDNWEDGKRAKNATDKVYLFSPKKTGDSFPNYGAALIECETDAEQNEIAENDKGNGRYDEYITSHVSPDEITRIFVPEGFFDLVPDAIRDRVTACKMTAKTYIRYEYVDAPADLLETFYKTASAYSTQDFNYFRGTNDRREVIDLYEVRYEI